MLLISFKVTAQAINYTYDSLNRLTQVIYTDSSIIKYAYDDAGNRLSKKVIQSPIFKACPQSNISFFAGSNDNTKTYQWQVATTGGFNNISNQLIYSGANSPTLTLNNPPTNWYGYKYRCIISGSTVPVITAPQTIKFQSTWTGNINTSWENVANWGCAVVPDENTDVILNSASSFYPILSSNASIRSLTAKPSASVSVASGFKLTITGKSQ